MTRKSQWGRSQKYLPRDRILYALLFPNDYCYIGQSVDVMKREQQHRGPKGGWRQKKFRCLVLGNIHGTEKDAVEMEHAWRIVAARNGWKVYAKPPDIVCNPMRQATQNRHRLSRDLRWPVISRRSRGGWGKWVFWLSTATILLYFFNR